MEMLKQSDSYGCGLYAVANVLSYSGFVTDKRLEQSKNGNNVGQLTRWLNDDGVDIFIDAIKFTGRLSSIPNLSFNLDPDAVYYPLLMTIKASRKFNHMLGLCCYPDGKVCVYDSSEDEPIWLDSWDDVRYKYKRIYGIFNFRDFENKEVYLTN